MGMMRLLAFALASTALAGTATLAFSAEPASQPKAAISA
jgi:hypothetical protein